MATGTKNRARQLTRAMRAEKAAELCAQGKTFRTIAQELGISRTEANRLVLMAHRRYWENAGEIMNAYRSAECDRLDAVIESHWEKATHPDDYPDSAAHAQVVLKASDQKHKLRGAYPKEPRVQVNVTALDPREAEVEFLRLGLTKPQLPPALEVIDATLANPAETDQQGESGECGSGGGDC